MLKRIIPYWPPRILSNVDREVCRGGEGDIGMLLPINCGHNSEYSPYERLKLTEVRTGEIIVVSHRER